MKALTIENLHKSFSDFEALKGLNFDIDPGQCLGLLGVNGAGKSTTIKIITGQLSADQGSVKVYDLSPATELKKVHELVGLVPEGQSLYEEISVYDNIDLFRGINELDKDETIQIIQRLGLSEKSNTKVKDLSKGLRQRVLIARAIIHKPKLLLLDEPTSGLDPGSSENIYKILSELKETGTTILLTTHLMNDVERLCDQIVFINKGKVVAQGSPAELKRKYRTNEVEVISQAPGTAQEKIYKLKLDELGMQELNQITARETIITINTHEPKLEEVFIHLTEDLV